VGPTGGGKTTIVSLLLRFYEVTKGRILIDGVDIRTLKQRELRRRMGLVLQDIYLFPGNLEANLTLGRDVTRKSVDEAAGLTLSDRIISRLPGGYDADLSERGANVSVGERQLLSFTRAIVHDPELLILDEATSAVDPATEATIGTAMEQTLAGRTALIIAHRLSTIRRCDIILVVHHGEIAESGSHEGLIAAGGLYRKLHDLQLTEGRYAAHEPS
jgi:ATP-binding cassette subfamily B protein